MLTKCTVFVCFCYSSYSSSTVSICALWYINEEPDKDV